MSKGDETRAAILDRAVAEASRLGLAGLTLGSLARQTGLSKSGLFAHFGSKEDLELAVLAAGVERFVARVMAPAFKAPRGLPRIEALFEGWLAWHRAPDLPGGCLFVGLANELDDRPGPLRDRLVAYQRDWIETLATAARIAVAEGHFRADLDCEQFAYDFYSIELAYHHFHRLLRDPDAERRARNAFAELVTLARAASA
ncbi:MAG TPA: TetR/AcrR family transcriptional regulator [Thermoanaerobaculia bacterium]|nr:TetR/AcrR family transcriptional regulator [Thermoanaerobaculia bacterium]